VIATAIALVLATDMRQDVANKTAKSQCYYFHATVSRPYHMFDVYDTYISDNNADSRICCRHGALVLLRCRPTVTSRIEQ